MLGAKKMYFLMVMNKLLLPLEVTYFSLVIKIHYLGILFNLKLLFHHSSLMYLEYLLFVVVF